MRSPKLLYFVSEDWYFCSHRLPLAVAAHETGFEVVVATRVREHGEVIRQAGIGLIPFEMSRRGMHLFGELGTLARLVALYRREKPDLVHHVAMKPVLYGMLASRLAGVPHAVNALAGMGWLFTSTSLTARLIKPLVRLAFRFLLRSSSVIVQNPDDLALMTSMGLTDISIIRGAGIDLQLFQPVPEPAGPPLVVLPSRMLWDKGVGEFVEAARQLKKRDIVARFALVGAPDPENPATLSEARLAAWQDEGMVEWWGQHTDMPKVYAQAHIVCLPSYREGLPQVLLEAAACGRPIVTTDVTGCRDTVMRNGENGVLVPVRDASALASALAKLIEDPDLRRRMGEHGRAYVVGEFSQERIISETLAVYQEEMKSTVC